MSLTSTRVRAPRPRLAVTVADAKGRVAGPYRLVSSRSGGRLTGCPAKSTRRHRAARSHR